jgi:hypothetical protein
MTRTNRKFKELDENESNEDARCIIQLNRVSQWKRALVDIIESNTGLHYHAFNSSQ